MTDKRPLSPTEEQLRYLRDRLHASFPSVDNPLGLSRDDVSRLLRHDEVVTASLPAFLKAVATRLAAKEPAQPQITLGDGAIKPIAAQCALLEQHLRIKPDYDQRLAHRPLAPGMMGALAVPDWRQVSKSYEQAVVYAQLGLARAFRQSPMNTRMVVALPEPREPGSSQKAEFRQSKRTRGAFAKIAERQPGHAVFIIQAQIGTRFENHTPQEARTALEDDEFGLDLFTILCLLITHGGLANESEGLELLCLGDNRLVRHSGVWGGETSEYEAVPTVSRFSNEFNIGGMGFHTNDDRLKYATGIVLA